MLPKQVRAREHRLHQAPQHPGDSEPWAKPIPPAAAELRAASALCHLPLKSFSFLCDAHGPALRMAGDRFLLGFHTGLGWVAFQGTIPVLLSSQPKRNLSSKQKTASARFAFGFWT